MIPSCPGCGISPALDSLTVHYQYPRAVPIMEAADPWFVFGSSPIRTCGSVSCQAAGLLAVLDEVITDTALTSGRLLDREDVRIVEVGRPEDLTYRFIDPGEAS